MGTECIPTQLSAVGRVRATVRPVNVSTEGVCSYDDDVTLHASAHKLRRRNERDDKARARRRHVERNRLCCSEGCLYLHARPSALARAHVRAAAGEAMPRRMVS